MTRIDANPVPSILLRAHSLPSKYELQAMKKQEIVAALRRELQSVIAQRCNALTDPAAGAARAALRRFQSQRMADTHADLLAATESSAAARFFLSDLYGDRDLTQRDAGLERIVPMMERMLPVPALETIAEAIALDALSESLDGAMARRLGEAFSEGAYISAYREVTKRSDRERQLAHIVSVGTSLCELVRVPMIGSTLAMMRGPAKLARLGELHNFLERGFKAFDRMRNPQAFVMTITQREHAIMDRLYAGQALPFDLQPSDG